MARIVAVDDSVTMRKVIELAFQGEGHTVTTVASGEEALRLASERGADLVIADLTLPSMNGYEISQRLAHDPKLGHVPVIVLASANSPYDSAKGAAMGVSDSLNKPFETQHLLDKTRAALSQAVAPQAARAFDAVASTRVVSPTQALASQPKPAPAATASPVNLAAPGMGMPKQAVPAGLAKTSMGLGIGGVLGGAAPPSVAPTAAVVAAAVRPAQPAAPVAAPVAASAIAAPMAAAPSAVAQAVQSANAGLAAKLPAGLSAEQTQAILALTREVVERVVWEIVPDLAETIIRDEIRRLTRA